MASLHAQGDGLRVAAEAKADQKLQALTQEAERGGRDIYVATHLPLKRFIFAAKSTLQQGRECFEGNDLQRAYVLLMRFTTFFLERLPEHGEFSKPPAAAERKMLKTECKRVLDDLGPLKAGLGSVLQPRRRFASAPRRRQGSRLPKQPPQRPLLPGSARPRQRGQPRTLRRRRQLLQSQQWRNLRMPSVLAHELPQ